MSTLYIIHRADISVSIDVKNEYIKNTTSDNIPTRRALAIYPVNILSIDRGIGTGGDRDSVGVWPMLVSSTSSRLLQVILSGETTKIPRKVQSYRHCQTSRSSYCSAVWSSSIATRTRRSPVSSEAGPTSGPSVLSRD